MARKKVKVDMIPIYSIEEANEALRLIAESQRFIAEKTGDMNERIDAIKKETAEVIESRSQEITRRELGLQAFAETRKETMFDKARSKTLTFGVIGFRKSTQLKTLSKVTWKKVLEALKRRKDKAGIRIKEEVDKDELHKWSEPQLEKVGVYKKSEDVFYYEIDEEEIKAHAGNE
ncbi:host-nuclease inhibitor Gam family protein [Nitrospina gracilis]|uniref:host-nuclease inhibitor Gam family protein n=1 Tax=Nitrospina gracilis TaxID=35801 RepID=UPI001F42802D|nr:host-nuclease inhibitor Gam family protein [Nitrospina gracilis]MCF8719247.1 phage host-nuclease inhibitor protein Gam [Nitrospina gracilis Nb-211]